MIEHAHAVVDALVKVLRLAGAAIILGGVVLASVRFAVDRSTTNWSDAYQRYHAGLSSASFSVSSFSSAPTSSRRSPRL